MDINEIPDRQIRRHPWELSRTESVLWELGRFLPDKKKKGICIDFGAGDQFFDDALLSAYPNMSVIAVDVGYTPDALGSLPARKNAERIQTALSLSDVSETGAEFALMMDSLEYITDEAACIRELASHVRGGGFLFLTLPACTALTSDHDVFVNSLRRYDRKYINGVLEKVPELRILKEHYFYSTLFPVRLAQRVLPVSVPDERQTINCWKYGKKHPITKTAKAVLNADYRLNSLLGDVRLDVPGLSLFIACKKI